MTVSGAPGLVVPIPTLPPCRNDAMGVEGAPPEATSSLCATACRRMSQELSRRQNHQVMAAANFDLSCAGQRMARPVDIAQPRSLIGRYGRLAGDLRPG